MVDALQRKTWNEAFRAKASRYTREQAQAAIADCHDTLRINPDASDSYVTEKWCEIDAMRDRLMALDKRKVAA